MEFVNKNEETNNNGMFRVDLPTPHHVTRGFKIAAWTVTIGVIGVIAAGLVLTFLFVWSNAVTAVKVFDSTTNNKTIISSELKKASNIKKINDCKAVYSKEYRTLYDGGYIDVSFKSGFENFYLLNYTKYVPAKTSFFISISADAFHTDTFKIVLLPQNSTSQSYFDYLYNMTYSIYSPDANTAGTGWLLSHIVNYEFYLATNLHVTWNIRNSSEPTIYYKWNRTNAITFSDYTRKFSTTEVITYTNFANQSSGIDLSIVRVSFGNFVGTLSNDDIQLKARLDAYIAHSGASIYEGYGKSTEKNPFYIGGYPWNNNQANWEEHTIFDSSRSLDTFSHYIPSKDGEEYAVDDTRSYMFGKEVYIPNVEHTGVKPWMNHGASGSAIINKNYDIVAIYWGGWYDEDDNWFIPGASPIGKTFVGNNSLYYHK